MPTDTTQAGNWAEWASEPLAQFVVVDVVDPSAPATAPAARVVCDKGRVSRLADWLAADVGSSRTRSEPLAHWSDEDRALLATLREPLPARALQLITPESKPLARVGVKLGADMGITQANAKAVCGLGLAFLACLAVVYVLIPDKPHKSADEIHAACTAEAMKHPGQINAYIARCDAANYRNRLEAVAREHSGKSNSGQGSHH